ncbi:MAG TPA: transporter substrate-binding domain-containing protein [Candidatus Dormibacteraeota bacterium]|nr:transporter substrate-binding domain-containing protein [Candidatus Dormibacteraeota bacterium]
MSGRGVSRRDLLRMGGIAGLALPAAGLLAACGSSPSTSSTTASSAGDPLLAKVRKAGVINIGLANDPPASIINPNGTVSGLGPVVVEKIMKKLGVPKVKGEVATFGELIPGLQAGRWDMIGGVISVTKARCAVVLYSDPFQYNGLEIAYFPDAVSPAPKTIADVVSRGLTAGFNSGSAYIAYCQSKGMSASKVVQFPDTPSLLAALQEKRIQVVVSDTGSLTLTAQQVKQYPFHHVDYPKDGPFICGALAFRPSDKVFAEAFGKEFTALKQSGEFAKISKEFDSPPFPKNLAPLTAKQACSRVS